MGKAAILVGPAVIIVLGFIVYAIARMIIKSGQEPKNVRQNAQLAEDAMQIFRNLMIVTSLDGDNDILSEKSKNAIKAWAEKYRKVNS